MTILYLLDELAATADISNLPETLATRKRAKLARSSLLNMSAEIDFDKPGQFTVSYLQDLKRTAVTFAIVTIDGAQQAQLITLSGSLGQNGGLVCEHQIHRDVATGETTYLEYNAFKNLFPPALRMYDNWRVIDKVEEKLAEQCAAIESGARSEAYSWLTGKHDLPWHEKAREWGDPLPDYVGMAALLQYLPPKDRSAAAALYRETVEQDWDCKDRWVNHFRKWSAPRALSEEEKQKLDVAFLPLASCMPYHEEGAKILCDAHLSIVKKIQHSCAEMMIKALGLIGDENTKPEDKRVLGDAVFFDVMGFDIGRPIRQARAELRAGAYRS